LSSQKPKQKINSEDFNSWKNSLNY